MAEGIWIDIKFIIYLFNDPFYGSLFESIELFIFNINYDRIAIVGFL